MTARLIPILGVMAMLFATLPAASLPVRAFERAEFFATCSGRFEALATRQRAHQEAEADASARLSAEFDLMLESVLPLAIAEGVPETQPTRWRSQGWVEIAALLADADYSFDQQSADLARSAMARHIATCREVLL